MPKIALVLVVLSLGCSGPVVQLEDAGAAQLADANASTPHGALVDAGAVSYDQAYGSLLSTWSATCAEPFTRELCPWPEDATPSARAVDRCVRQLGAVEGCEAAREVLDACVL